MASNPLSQRRAEAANDSVSRPLIRATGNMLDDLIATANAHCSRPELEWFNDGQGGMKLGYKREWSRQHAALTARVMEDERQRYIRNLARSAGERETAE